MQLRKTIKKPRRYEGVLEDDDADTSPMTDRSPRPATGSQQDPAASDPGTTRKSSLLSENHRQARKENRRVAFSSPATDLGSQANVPESGETGLAQSDTLRPLPSSGPSRVQQGGGIDQHDQKAGGWSSSVAARPRQEQVNTTATSGDEHRTSAFQPSMQSTATAGPSLSNMDRARYNAEMMASVRADAEGLGPGDLAAVRHAQDVQYQKNMKKMKELAERTDEEWFMKEMETSSEEGSENETQESPPPTNGAPTWQDLNPGHRLSIVDHVSGEVHLLDAYAILGLTPEEQMADYEKRVRRSERENAEEERIKAYQQAVHQRMGQPASGPNACRLTSDHLQEILNEHLYQDLEEPEQGLCSREEHQMARTYLGNIGLNHGILEEWPSTSLAEGAENLPTTLQMAEEDHQGREEPQPKRPSKGDKGYTDGPFMLRKDGPSDEQEPKKKKGKQAAKESAPRQAPSNTVKGKAKQRKRDASAMDPPDTQHLPASNKGQNATQSEEPLMSGALPESPPPQKKKKSSKPLKRVVGHLTEGPYALQSGCASNGSVVPANEESPPMKVPALSREIGPKYDAEAPHPPENNNDQTPTTSNPWPLQTALNSERPILEGGAEATSAVPRNAEGLEHEVSEPPQLPDKVPESPQANTEGQNEPSHINGPTDDGPSKSTKDSSKKVESSQEVSASQSSTVLQSTPASELSQTPTGAIRPSYTIAGQQHIEHVQSSSQTTPRSKSKGKEETIAAETPVDSASETKQAPKAEEQSPASRAKEEAPPSTKKGALKTKPKKKARVTKSRKKAVGTCKASKKAT